MSVEVWSAEKWGQEARGVRNALAALGILVPFCLPGEKDHCGQPAVDHYVNYLAKLNAQSAVMAMANLDEAQQVDFDHQARHFGEELLSELEDDS